MTAEPDEAVTAEQFAALEFEPWRDVPMPPTNEEWARRANPYLVTIRLGWVIVQKTKPDLMNSVEGIASSEGDAWENMMECFDDTLAFFRGWLALLECAHARTIGAAAALAEAHDA